MNNIKLRCLISLITLLLSCQIFAEEGTAGYTPDSWWPSEWGADDQLGALNRLDANKVLPR